MSEPEYFEVKQAVPTDKYEPVRLSFKGVKIELPDLASSQIPLEIVQVVALWRSTPQLTDEQQAQISSVFLAYFQTRQPLMWETLSKTDAPLENLFAIVRAWLERSHLDPKKPASSVTSTKFTA